MNLSSSGPRLSLDAIRAQGFFEGFKPGGPRRRKDVRLYILGEQAEPGPNPHTRLSLDAIRAPGFFEGSSQAARGGGKLSVFISEESRLSLDPICVPGFLKDSTQKSRTENHTKKEAANAQFAAFSFWALFVRLPMPACRPLPSSQYPPHRPARWLGGRRRS